MIRAVLCDDHALVREGLRAVLCAEGRCEIVGQASDGLRVAELVQRLTPDVLVLDVMLPGLNGIEVCRQIAVAGGPTRVLMLSTHANEAYVLASLRAGAYGYVLKDTAVTELLRAVEAIAAGRRYLSHPFADRAVEAYANQPAVPGDPYDTLTAREREVLQLAAEGHANAEIGRRLHVSARTVEIHRSNLLRKLNIAGPELVRWAVRRGIIGLD